MGLEVGLEALSLNHSKIESNSEQFLNLKSSDEQTFKVGLETVRQSVTIRTMLDDLGIDGEEEDNDTLLPLPEVSGPVLKKAMVWCEKHKGKHMAIYISKVFLGVNPIPKVSMASFENH